MQNAVRYLAGRNSSAVKFDRVEIALIFSFILLAESLTDKGGQYLEKTLDDELQKMPHIKARKFQPQPRLEPANQHWWQARKADVLTITPRVAPDQDQNLRVKMFHRN